MSTDPMNERRTPIWAIVLVKGFRSAKSRLNAVLSEAEREALARGMFERLLGVLVASPKLAGVIVATDSAEVAKISERHGASAFRDPPDARTLADVADAALSNVSARGAGAALVLVSDLPEATGEDVDRLIDEMEAFDVVLARDSRGVHTNALGLRLETGFRTRFGSAESAREHRESAERAGLSVGDVQSPTLSFDVDTPEDYALLLARS